MKKNEIQSPACEIRDMEMHIYTYPIIPLEWLLVNMATTNHREKLIRFLNDFILKKRG